MSQAKKVVDAKVVMLGRQSVGKTALVERFAHDRWTPATTSTIGGSFCAKEVSVPDPRGKQGAMATVTLGVWDTAGSERYESLTKHYFNGANSSFICFDLTDLASWHKVAFWVEELHKVEPNCRVYLIGCKADLVAANQGTQATTTRTRGASGLGSPSVQRTRCVTKEEVLQYCSSIGPEPAQYCETSSLTGAGIQAAFQLCCSDWLSKPKKDSYAEFQRRQGTIQLDADRNERRGFMASCCGQ